MRVKDLESHIENTHVNPKPKDKKFVCHASTWLHQKRFLDYEDYKMQEVHAPKSSNNNWYDDLEI